jgi:hypothetical protein
VVRLFWRADVNAFVVLLARSPEGFPDALTGAALPGVARVSTSTTCRTIGPPGRDHQLTETGPLPADAPLGLWLPLDADLPYRLAAASALWRELGGVPTRPPSGLTQQRRARLIETLRALDGRLAGANAREIASCLFGSDQLPAGRDWRVHDLRSRTRRLVDSGLALMRGGYRALLRPGRRR